MSEESVLRIARALEGRALLVVDEAYIEFASVASLARRVREIPQLAVLRTLSKAHGLAGARCGFSVIAAPELIAPLRKVISPYAIAQLTVECALAFLTTSQLAMLPKRVAVIQAERERLAHEIRKGRSGCKSLGLA